MNTIYNVCYQKLTTSEIDTMISGVPFSRKHTRSKPCPGVLKVPLRPIQELWERVLDVPFYMNALLLEIAHMSFEDFRCAPYGIETFRKILSEEGFSGELNDMGWLVEELTICAEPEPLNSVCSLAYVFGLCILHEMHKLRYWQGQFTSWRSQYKVMQEFSQNLDAATRTLLWDCVCGKSHIPWWFCEPQIEVVSCTISYYLEEKGILPESWEQLYDFSRESYNLKMHLFEDVYDRFAETDAELKEFSDKVNAGWNPEPIERPLKDETYYKEVFFWNTDNVDLKADVGINFEWLRELNQRIADGIRPVVHRDEIVYNNRWIIYDKCGLYRNDHQAEVQHLSKCLSSHYQQSKNEESDDKEVDDKN